MARDEYSISVADNARFGLTKDRVEKIPPLYWIVTILIFGGIWQTAAYITASDLLLPYPITAVKALGRSLISLEVIGNFAITMRRVLTGFAYAVAIGVPLGFLMGYSKMAMNLLDPLVSSMRQIPIMAWVPLTIIWFGLGDAPTIFIIAFSGAFPMVLNTIAGVQNISQDYYNAARSMGASRLSILTHIIFPGSLPAILTGMRIALSSGWMSVI